MGHGKKWAGRREREKSLTEFKKSTAVTSQSIDNNLVLKVNFEQFQIVLGQGYHEINRTWESKEWGEHLDWTKWKIIFLMPPGERFSSTPQRGESGCLHKNLTVHFL